MPPSPFSGGRAASTYIYGIDFGTSNSSITIWDVERRDLVRDPHIAGVESSFMYFPYTLRKDPPLIGNAAKLRYVQDEMRGRFFQAIKTILPNRTFSETIVNNQPFQLEELIAFFLRFLKAKGDLVTGQDVKRVVMGRPAVFSTDPEEDALAQARLLRAAQLAGFEEIHSMYSRRWLGLKALKFVAACGVFLSPAARSAGTGSGFLALGLARAGPPVSFSSFVLRT